MKRKETAFGERTRKTRPTPTKKAPPTVTVEGQEIRSRRREIRDPVEIVATNFSNQLKVYPNIDTKTIDRFREEIKSYPNIMYINMRTMAGAYYFIYMNRIRSIEDLTTEIFENDNEIMGTILEHIPDIKKEPRPAPLYKADLLRYVYHVLQRRELPAQYVIEQIYE